MIMLTRPQASLTLQVARLVNVKAVFSRRHLGKDGPEHTSPLVGGDDGLSLDRSLSKDGDYSVHLLYRFV
jgi:hypothetical protein